MEKENVVTVGIYFETGNHPPYNIQISNAISIKDKISFLESFIENCCFQSNIPMESVQIFDKNKVLIKEKNDYFRSSHIYLKTLNKSLFPSFVDNKEYSYTSKILTQIKESGRKSLTFLQSIPLFSLSKSKKETQEQSQNYTDISLELQDKQTEILLQKSLNETPLQNKAGSQQKKKSPSEIIPKKTEKHYLLRSGEIFTDSIPFEKGSLIFSFMPSSTLFNPEQPPPLYMSLNQVEDEKGRSKEACLKGLEIQTTGELKCVDDEVLKSQKGLISELIKTLAQSIAEGRGIVGVSLPIRIFEPRSLIERIVDWWSYLPIYAQKCVESKDPIFRMKCCIAFYLAGLHVGISLYKPFNPILGETYQGFFPDGTSINCEHISHHPPITNFYVVGNKFKFYGSYEYAAKTSSTYNEISMYQNGETFIEFFDGQKIQLRLPAAVLHGMMWGDKSVKINGVLNALDEKNHLKGIIGVGYIKKGNNFSSSKQSDILSGCLYEYEPSNHESTSKNIKSLYKEEMKMQDVKKIISEISGSWLDSLKFDKEEFWNINKDRPTKHKPHPNPLPSDSRFREDLIWLKSKNQKFAQKWKLELEKRQRFEKKLRTDNEKNHK